MVPKVKKGRLIELDIAKGIAILSVIMVHINQDFRLINTGIAYHLSVFFAVSGFLMSQSSTNENLVQQIKKKVKSILIPYLLLSAIYIIIFTIIKLLLEGGGYCC